MTLVLIEYVGGLWRYCGHAGESELETPDWMWHDGWPRLITDEAAREVYGVKVPARRPR
jgi:hypothetical protein